MESDLYLALNTSALHKFRASDKSKMKVETFRNSKKNGIVKETTATYRKGRINLLRINFNIIYTEFFVLEDRKKSLGKYEFNNANEIRKYERTDFDTKNRRAYTLFYNYKYTNSIVNREFIRTREYIGNGTVEQDSVVYLDSVLYEVKPISNGQDQHNLSDPGVYTSYEIKEGKLLSKTNNFPGYTEKITYTYDSKNQLVKIENVLTNTSTEGGSEQSTITTHTDLHYTMDGLISEAVFYDQSNEVLERKVYTYK
ncbi:MAG: hypothetical protein ABJF27_13570 [Crocinitomicaceae bacterium]